MNNQVVLVLHKLALGLLLILKSLCNVSDFFKSLSKSLITIVWRGRTWCIQGMVLNMSTQFVLLRENWFATGTTPPLPPPPPPNCRTFTPPPPPLCWTCLITITWIRLTIMQQCLSNLLLYNLPESLSVPAHAESYESAPRPSPPPSPPPTM